MLIVVRKVIIGPMHALSFRRKSRMKRGPQIILLTYAHEIDQ